MHAATQGPYSALAQAEEELARLQREITSEELRLAAIRLLRTTVEESRNAALGCSGGSSGSRRNAYAAAHRW